MSWSDLFYPGNPERREKLIRKSQEVWELMKSNFRATNQLGEILNKYLGSSFSPITLNEKATVKENCEVFTERIHEIQAKVEEIDKKLKEELEPTLYEKLKDSLSLSVPDFQFISSVVHAVCGGAAMSTLFLIGWLIYNTDILANMIDTSNLVAKGLLGTLVLGVLFTGIDMIAQAIIGSIERDKLERALEEYDKALKEFRPASYTYQENIMYVKISLTRILPKKTSTI